MKNAGVKCDVCECIHNQAPEVCSLGCIEVTHQKAGVNAVDVPHFCKSYQKK